MKAKLSAEKLQELLKYWPALTFITGLLGYIGFFTYAAANSLPHIQPDISTVIAIGLFNITIITCIYLAASSRRPPEMWQAIVLCGYIQLLSINPLFVAVFMAIPLFRFDALKGKRAKKSFKSFAQIRQDVKKFKRREPVLVVFGGLGLMAITLFFDGKIATVILVVYFAMYMVHRIKRTSIMGGWMFLALLVLATPCFTTYYLLADSGYSLVGISKTRAVVHTKTNDFNGIIVYRDNNFLYLQPTNAAVSIGINISDVMRVENGEFFPKRLTAIDSFKDLYTKYWKHKKQPEPTVKITEGKTNVTNVNLGTVTNR